MKIRIINILVALITTVAASTTSRQSEAAIQFDPAVNYAVQVFPTSIEAAHLNVDAYLDLVVTNSASDTVSVLLNAGNGTFAGAVDYPTGLGSFAVTAGKLDDDGDLDLAVANQDAGTVSILLNNGDGTFFNGATLNVGLEPRALVAADLNADLKADLAVANRMDGTVSVLINLGGGVFASAVDYAAGQNLRAIVAGDLDGDTYPDLAVSSHGTNVIALLLNNSDGTFVGGTDISMGLTYKPEALAVAQVDGDQLLDLAVTATGDVGGQVTVWRNDGGASFSALSVLPSGPDPAAVRIGDLNGDLLPDLVVADRGLNTVSTYRNQGAGTFQSPVGLPSGNDPYYLAIGDFTNQGRIDIAAPNSASNTISVLINQTVAMPGDVDGNDIVDINDVPPFVAVILDPSSATPAAASASDLNNDSTVDGLDIQLLTDALQSL